MRRPWNGAMPVMLTLPLGLERRPRRRQRRLRRLAVGALIALGVALLAAGFWLPAKAELAQHLLNRAWHRTTVGDAAAKPWPWADTHPVARLKLPGSDEPLTVLAGASGRNLAFAPTLLDGSAAPGFARRHRHRRPPRHALPLAGDARARRRAHARTARRLGPDATRSRRSTSSTATRAELRLDADESIVVLVTCWPFEAVTVGGSWRYVVTARQRF